MARFVTTVRTPLPPAEAFGYMADLRNFEHWDPGVRRVTQAVGEGGGPDTEFDVVVDAPRPGGLEMRYVTVHHDPPDAVVVEARTRLLTSRDRIDVRPDDGGSLVRYDAELVLNGPLRVLDVLLRPVFERIASRAEAGLERALDGEAT